LAHEESGPRVSGTLGRREAIVFAIPGLLLLVLLDIFKPFQYVPIFASLPLLYVFTGLVLVGFLVDLRLGLSRIAPAPQLGLAIVFLVWAILTDVPQGVGTNWRQGFALVVPIILFALIAHVVQTVRALRAITVVMVVVGVSLAFIGVHQGFAPWGCHKLFYRQGVILSEFDGRPCSQGDMYACTPREAQPGVGYVCERVGLLGTRSVGGRVQFRGTMEDPNDLAVFVGATFPLALVLIGSRRGARRWLLIGIALLAGTCVVLTRSRGGQIVVLGVLAVYCWKRFGARGLALGLLGALPILILGGRHTAEASASSLERLECWSVGLQMFGHSPLIGVGLGQFTEHHYLTAHNSLVLTAAELGAPGMVLWSSIVYLSLKIPWQALRDEASGASSPLDVSVRGLCLAVLASLTGMVLGMFFLSYAYKEVLWIFMGLSGALYQAIRRHIPAFRVRFGARDLALVVAGCFALLAAIALYTRVKLGA
jgi:O-antigen ligase